MVWEKRERYFFLFARALDLQPIIFDQTITLVNIGVQCIYFITFCCIIYTTAKNGKKYIVNIYHQLLDREPMKVFTDKKFEFYPSPFQHLVPFYRNNNNPSSTSRGDIRSVNRRQNISAQR